jgi:hypothetical protein
MMVDPFGLAVGAAWERITTVLEDVRREARDLRVRLVELGGHL